MLIGGSAPVAALRRGAGRVVRTPAFGVAVIVPLVLVMAVGASAPSPRHAVTDDGITPLASVARASDGSGTAVVASTKAPVPFRIVAANLSAPPPAIVVNSPGSLGIPAMALSAYRNAERMMAGAYPGCGVGWNLLAGIGRIESQHAFGGATDARGTPVRAIYGPALDGTLPGNEVIVHSVAPGRVTYARAMGPMQFLPGTWSRYASDGDGDGRADVQNLYDSTLGAARYLCSGNLNLRDKTQVMSAILRYNNSVAYAQNVLGWAAAYATGVVPVDLPEISGPAPPLGDTHLDVKPEGLGPGIPLSAAGLPGTDLATLPLLDVNGQPVLTGSPLTAAQTGTPGGPVQNCAVFCLTPQPAAPPPPAEPPALAPLGGPLPPPFGPPPPPLPEPAPGVPPVLGPAPGPAA